ncbi:MAG: glycosyltransferase [Patescibacteria group bacterium]
MEKVGAGIVIEKDEKQLTEAILKILNNPDLAKKMGENGRKLVEKEFSCDKVAEKWTKEYNKIIKNA